MVMAISDSSSFYNERRSAGLQQSQIVREAQVMLS
jgi:hypothetical protein